MPRTGRYAESGLGVSRGIEMVVNAVNAAGGIKSLGGGKINLVTADDGSEASKTSLEARRLMSDDKVSFVLGPYSTPEAQAFMPVAERYQIGGVGLQTTIVPTTQYFSTISISAEGFGRATPIWCNAAQAGRENRHGCDHLPTTTVRPGRFEDRGDGAGD